MAKELIINASLPETRIALMEDGEIQELLIERASEKGIVGNIYIGRVTRVLPGMQAAFVDIGLEKAAFLYVDDVYVPSKIIEDEESHGIRPAVTSVIEELSSDLASSSIEDLSHEEGPEDNSSHDIQAKELVLTSSTESHSNVEVPEESHVSDESVQEVESDEIVEEGDSEEDPERPIEMGPPPGDDSDDSESPTDFPGTIVNQETTEENATLSSSNESASVDENAANATGRKPHRRGRRGVGARFRNKKSALAKNKNPQNYPENYKEQVADPGLLPSDRAGLDERSHQMVNPTASDEEGRPENQPQDLTTQERRNNSSYPQMSEVKSELKMHRSQDRRIRPKPSVREPKSQVNIQDLLKEGQEVLVQVAKDPISSKGARLTCHISLPGRHLVCMPTIDHIGVSRRIERDDERRRLREFVERNRPKNLGFIVRTASGKQQSERRIQQDIDYLTHLWNEIKEKANSASAPALVYEDLNSVLRAIRDWVTEEIDKVIVDSRPHFQDIQKFVSYFMPPLKQKIELYHGDIPIFDAYGISTELSRALERKVWLKSGGYIVVDQAEALVAIDVNTGRYVGKKNLEDTILKTNLEAVKEIAYQLRLRNCGGIIILDLIDMEKEENKQRVYRALEDALQRDRARPSILKISELGLVEMTRKRTRDTMVRTLCESCSHCEGKGFIKSKQTVAYEAMREIEREGIERDVGKILVQAHPDIIDILAIDERDTLDQLEKRYRKLVYLQAVPDFHPEQFEVSADKRPRSEQKVDYKRNHNNDHRHHHHNDYKNQKNQDNRLGENSEYSSKNRSSRDSNRHSPLPVIKPAQSVKEGENDKSSLGVQITPNAVAPIASDTMRIQKVEKPKIDLDSIGNQQMPSSLSGPSHFSASESLGNSIDQKHEGDDSFEEEDRLAFLRAQAAQDAALARLGNSNGNSNPNQAPGRMDRPSTNNNGRRHQRNGQGPGNLGRKNGKFRRPNSHVGQSPQGSLGNHDRHKSPKFGFQPKKPNALSSETVGTSSASVSPRLENDSENDSNSANSNLNNTAVPDSTSGSFSGNDSSS